MSTPESWYIEAEEAIRRELRRSPRSPAIADRNPFRPPTRDEVADGDDDILFLDPPDVYDGALLGRVVRADGSSFALYSMSRCEQLCSSAFQEACPLPSHDDCDHEGEALEWLSFNTYSAWVGPGTPAFLIDDEVIHW